MMRGIHICLILLTLTVFTSGQTDNKALLATFEKSIESGQFEVERDLFAYVRSNPNDAAGFLLMAKLRLRQDRLAEARSLGSKALSLDPALVSAKLVMAQIWYRLGEIGQSRQILDSIKDLELKSDADRLQLARTSMQIGDCARALTVAEKLSLNVKNRAALPIRGSCYLETGDKRKLSALIPLAAIAAKQDPNGAAEFAEVLIRGRLLKEAVDILRVTVSAAPKDLAALLLLARAEIFFKDFVNAKSHLAQAEAIAPNSAELYFVRSLLESEQNNIAGAYDSLEKSLSINSNDPKVLAQYVLVAIQVNQTGRALRAAEKLLSLQPGNPEALYLHGIAALQNNNLQAAEASLVKYTEVRPNDSRGCIALGLTYAGQTEKLETARGQMLKCLEIDPKNFEAAYQLGLSYKTAGDFATATKYFEQTVRLAPKYAAGWRELGVAYLQTGAETKARPMLEKAVALNPEDADTHFQLSRLYNLLGERELAKKHLELFRKLRPTKPDGM